MYTRLIATAITATLAFSEAEAREFVVSIQDIDDAPSATPFYPSLDPVPYAEGESAKELFNNSTADISTSHGGGIRVESKQISPSVVCDKVSNSQSLTAYDYSDPDPLYICDYFGPSLGS